MESWDAYLGLFGIYPFPLFDISSFAYIDGYRGSSPGCITQHATPIGFPPKPSIRKSERVDNFEDVNPVVTMGGPFHDWSMLQG